jgi:RecB family exonuclease
MTWRFSHSSIGSYKQCPKRYELTYLQKGKVQKEDTVELFLGKRVHECLEVLYHYANLGNTWLLKDLTDLFIVLWEEKWNNDIKIVRFGLPALHYLDLGIKQLTDYYNKYHPFNQHKSLSLEQKLYFNLAQDEKYVMSGVIDRIEEIEPDYLAIHDYKTGKNMMSQKECDSDRQLATYAIGVLNKYPATQKIDLVWHYLLYNVEVVSSRTAEQLEKLKVELITDIDTISKAVTDNNFKTNISRLCDWCEVKKFCPAHK